MPGHTRRNGHAPGSRRFFRLNRSWTGLAKILKILFLNSLKSLDCDINTYQHSRLTTTSFCDDSR